jgi:hypothetical protein
VSTRRIGWLLFAVFALALPFPRSGRSAASRPRCTTSRCFAATAAVALVEGAARARRLDPRAVRVHVRSRLLACARSRRGCSRASSRGCPRARAAGRALLCAALLAVALATSALRDAVRPRAHCEPARGARMRRAALGARVACAAFAAAAGRAAVRAHRAREPCANYDPQRRPLFGDTHVHTAFSFDAWGQGTLARPRDAYRFARGEAIGMQPYGAEGAPQDARSSCAARSTSRSSPTTATCSARRRSARTRSSRATTRSCAAWCGASRSSATRS